MLKELNFEEIQEYFKELENHPTSKIQKAKLYGMARFYQEEEEKKSEINKLMGEDRKKKILDTIIISDSIAIIKTLERWTGEEREVYRPVVNGKFTMDCSYDLDYAIVIALANKYNEGNAAPRMIYNMLRMDQFDKSEK